MNAQSQIAAEPVLSVRDVTKTFGAIKAVQGVSFDVRPGEILGLIGPNGSGKSTLFNCILGQYPPTSGEVFVNGHAVAGRRACALNKLGVGRTFQQLSVFPQMSVIENIILAGQEHQGTMLSRLFGKPDAGLTEEAEKMIDFFRLGHLRDEKAGGLSYGQQKLVDAAMAFMAGPSLVLLDEPAGGVNLTMLGYLKERLIAYNAGARHHLRGDRAQHGIRHVAVFPHPRAGRGSDHRRGPARGDPLEPAGHRFLSGGLRC